MTCSYIKIVHVFVIIAIIYLVMTYREKLSEILFLRIYQRAEATWKQQQEEHAKNMKQEEFMKGKCNNYLADISNYEASTQWLSESTNEAGHSFVCSP